MRAPQTPEQMDELLAQTRIRLKEVFFSCCMDKEDLKDNFGDKIALLSHNYCEMLHKTRLKPEDKGKREEFLEYGAVHFEMIYCAFDLAFGNVHPSQVEEMVLKWWDGKAKRMSEAFEHNLHSRQRLVSAILKHLLDPGATP